MTSEPLLAQLIESLRCLPGVGPKSAQRMALHLLERNREGGLRLSEVLVDAMQKIGRCKQCRDLTELDICTVCANPARDQSLLCVVESPVDVLAIEQATAMGFLGGTSGFNCEVFCGAGAFVCGEETALIKSIEGQRGTPRPRPPFPSQRGLFGKPTAVNNVETLANIPRILGRGAEWFRAIGTPDSTGTKVFSLAGGGRVGGLL